MLVHPVELRDELHGDGGDVLRALAQRRDHEFEHAEPVIQVLAEGPLLHELPQAAVGGADDPHVHTHRFLGPDGDEGPVLQKFQDLGLRRPGKLVDLVQEDGPPVGELEIAFLALFVGTGERTAVVAEELAFDERLRDGGAVEADEGLVPARAGVMDGRRKDALARAGVPVDDERGIARRHTFHVGDGLLQARRPGDETVEREGVQPCDGGRPVVFGHIAARGHVLFRIPHIIDDVMEIAGSRTYGPVRIHPFLHKTGIGDDLLF